MINQRLLVADGSIHQFFAGIEMTKKKEVDIAEGVYHTALTSSPGLNQPALKVFTNIPKELMNAILKIL
jgi:hypothetical protein